MIGQGGQTSTKRRPTSKTSEGSSLATWASKLSTSPNWITPPKGCSRHSFNKSSESLKRLAIRRTLGFVYGFITPATAWCAIPTTSSSMRESIKIGSTRLKRRFGLLPNTSKIQPLSYSLTVVEKLSPKIKWSKTAFLRKKLHQVLKVQPEVMS